MSFGVFEFLFYPKEEQKSFKAPPSQVSTLTRLALAYTASHLI